jgi:glycosyltransferase involved in cell wall biosynthesis
LNIHIITSSYPASPEDPSGTAGLFVRQFALELSSIGHKVVVQPVARKAEYQPDDGITIVPMPWKGGDQELASMDLKSPRNWWIFSLFFVNGIRNTLRIYEKYNIDRTLCMWAVPSGIFGLAGKLKKNVPYDIWALGSDIWKIRKVPFFGKIILKRIVGHADRVFADGIELCKDVEYLAGVPCALLYSSRKLPSPKKQLFLSEAAEIKHFLFVGRYHVNKGPDLLIRAVGFLPHNIKESIRVHMFGLGPMEGELRNLISEMQLGKYIYLHGAIQAQEFSNYLNSVSFLVIPSRIESIPVVFSDALQIGTPVIAMPVGDLKQIINKFKCGIAVESLSAEALASAIEKASVMDKDSFLENTARAYKEFEISGTVNRWLNCNCP